MVTRNSLELVTRNSLDRVTRISSEWVTRNSSDLVPRNGLREIPGKSCRHFHRIPRKDSWEFPRIFRKIVTWDSDTTSTGYEMEIKLNFKSALDH